MPAREARGSPLPPPPPPPPPLPPADLLDPLLPLLSFFPVKREKDEEEEREGEEGSPLAEVELRPASDAPPPPPLLPKPKLRVERCLPPPLRPLRDSGVPTPPPATLPPTSAPEAALSLLPSRRCRRRRIGVMAPVATRVAALEMADMDP